MSRYLLDTNVLLHLVNKSAGHELIASRIAATPSDRIRISAPTVWEIARMVEKATHKHNITTKASKAAIVAMEWFHVEPLTQSAAAVSGNLHAWLANQGRTISERDSMIAGIALVHGYTMVTDNTREYMRVPGLRVENWRSDDAL